MAPTLSHRIKGNREWWGLWPTKYLGRRWLLPSSATFFLVRVQVQACQTFQPSMGCQNPISFFLMKFPTF